MSTILAWSRVTKKLYQRTPGGSWAEFAAQPTITGDTGGSMCAGLSDGSIIVLDLNGLFFRHWDPATSAWLDRAHPDPGSGDFSVCVDAGDGNAVAATFAGKIATYTAATTTWAILASLPGSDNYYDVAEHGTLTDIWVVQSAGWGEVKHYDGVSWTDHRAAIVAAIPSINPYRPYRITRTSTGALFIIASQSGAFPAPLYLIKRSPAGVWSLCGSYGSQGARGIWAADETHVWIQGPDAFGANDHLWLWNGTSIAYVKQLHAGGGTAPGVKSVHGIDATCAIACGVGVEINETIDGTAWNVTAGYAGSDVAQFGTLYPPPGFPLISCSEPSIGSDFSLNHYICLPTQHSSPTGNRVFSVPFSYGTPIGGILRSRISAPSGSVG